MASPQWKVYDSAGNYQSACKEVEAAAALMGFYGEGSTIRLGHSKIFWREGVDGDGGCSYDLVAETVAERVMKYQFDAYQKAHGKPHPLDNRAA